MNLNINNKSLHTKGGVVNHIRDTFHNEGVVIIDNFMVKDDFKKISNLWNYKKYFKSHEQKDKSAYGNDFLNHFTKTLSSGAQVHMRDLSWPDKDEVYMCNFSESSTLTKMKDVITVVNKLIKPIAEFILERNLIVGQFHANIYEKNGNNFSRVHNDGSTFHTDIGFILYMTKTNWKYDWGGLLHFLQPRTGGIIKTILPVSNRLVFINTIFNNVLTQPLKPENRNIPEA